MTPGMPSELLGDRLSATERVLEQLRQGCGDAPAALQSLRAHLLDILTLAERSPGLDAAADDLYESARASIAADGAELRVAARNQRLLSEAYLRFGQRLEAVHLARSPEDQRQP